VKPKAARSVPLTGSARGSPGGCPPYVGADARPTQAPGVPSCQPDDPFPLVMPLVGRRAAAPGGAVHGSELHEAVGSQIHDLMDPEPSAEVGDLQQPPATRPDRWPDTVAMRPGVDPGGWCVGAVVPTGWRGPGRRLGAQHLLRVVATRGCRAATWSGSTWTWSARSAGPSGSRWRSSSAPISARWPTWPGS
jgi:hypothetical protein